MLGLGRPFPKRLSLGHRALESNIIPDGTGAGIGNTAIGISALFKNTLGSDNTATGKAALSKNTIGNFNTAIGSQALSSNTTGDDNTAIGTDPLFSNTIGFNNTAIGYRNLFFNTTGNSNTAIGRGTLFSNTTGNNNTAVGRSTLPDVTIGSDNTAVGRGALQFVATSSNNMAIGFNAQVAVPTNNNQVRIGNAAVALASVQVAWTTTSDNRWKSNIQKSNLGLEFIKQLNPVFYTRKDVQDNEGKPIILESTSNPTTEYGFIAQELESALNNFNAKDNGIISKDDKGMLGVRYNDLLAPIVKAMQEQQVMIEELKAKIIKLENKN